MRAWIDQNAATTRAAARNSIALANDDSRARSRGLASVAGSTMDEVMRLPNALISLRNPVVHSGIGDRRALASAGRIARMTRQEIVDRFTTHVNFLAVMANDAINGHRKGRAVRIDVPRHVGRTFPGNVELTIGHEADH